MDPILQSAMTIAHKAGSLVASGFDRLDRVKIHEKSPNNFVTDVDQRSEDFIISRLQELYPDHSILSEESGHTAGKSPHLWVIDPLDGTTNFIHGIPHFAVSIALKENDKLRLGVIYDPIRQEMFTALRGSGAQRDRQRLRVSNRKKLGGSVLASGLHPFEVEEKLATHLAMQQALLTQGSIMRRSGSAALDLAYVAAGRFDACWQTCLNPWDMAAGALMVREAGGMVSDLQGSDDYLESRSMLAGNLSLYKSLLQLYNKTRACA